MKIEPPYVGLVVYFDYLWHAEFKKDIDDSLYARPCVVMGISENVETTCVFLAPISTKQPANTNAAVKIPEATRIRLGLEKPSWIICDNLNQAKWPGPDLKEIPGKKSYAFGHLPEPLYEQAKTKVLFCSERKKSPVLKVVKRS